MIGGIINDATVPFPLNNTIIGPNTMHNPVVKESKRVEYGKQKT